MMERGRIFSQEEKESLPRKKGKASGRLTISLKYDLAYQLHARTHARMA